MATPEKINELIGLEQFRVAVVSTFLTTDLSDRSPREQHVADAKMLKNCDALFNEAQPGYSRSLREGLEEYLTDQDVDAMIAFFSHDASQTLRGLAPIFRSVGQAWSVSNLGIPYLDAEEASG